MSTFRPVRRYRPLCPPAQQAGSGAVITPGVTMAQFRPTRRYAPRIASPTWAASFTPAPRPFIAKPSSMTLRTPSQPLPRGRVLIGRVIRALAANSGPAQYFARAYFPACYFAPTYFPGGTAVVGSILRTKPVSIRPPLPPSLPRGRVYASDSFLIASLPPAVVLTPRIPLILKTRDYPFLRPSGRPYVGHGGLVLGSTGGGSGTGGAGGGGGGGGGASSGGNGGGNNGGGGGGGGKTGNLHVGYQWLKPDGTPNTGQGVTYSVRRTSDSAQYNFQAGGFATSGGPFQAGLGESLSQNAFYSIVLGPLPSTVWPDGEYAVTIYGGGTALRTLYAELAGGDDGYSPAPFQPYPTLPALVATYFDRIVKDIQQVVVDVGLFLPTRSFVSLDPQPFPNAGGPQFFIQPGGFTNLQTQITGTGRHLTGATAQMVLHVADQMATDIAQQDTQAFLRVPSSANAAMGLYRLAALVMDALDQYTPTDAAGNYLTQEPIRPIGEFEPARYTANPNSQEWRGLTITYECKFTMKMAGTN